MTCAYNVSDLPERIASKIAEPDADGCWLWTAATDGRGYGKVWWRGRMVRTHRLVYELLVRKIPEALQIDHLCKVKGCANPAHLEPVTSCENTYRGAGPAVKNAEKTHCPRGHELSPDNLVSYAWIHRGERTCLICRRATNANSRQRLRAARLHQQTEVQS